MDQAATPARPYRTRLFALFAPGARKAVILRRGPRTYWRLIAWDLQRDVFTPGQWMRGQIRLFDLSPNGKKLIYFAVQHHSSAPWRQIPAGRPLVSRPYDPLTALATKPPRPGRRIPQYMRDAYRRPAEPARIRGTWTAISTPPYFTALALWPALGHMNGGGWFRDDHTVLINEPMSRAVPIENVPIPPSVHIVSWYGGDPTAQTPSDPDVDLRRALTDFGATWVEWVHRDGGDLLFACDG